MIRLKCPACQGMIKCENPHQGVIRDFGDWMASVCGRCGELFMCTVQSDCRPMTDREWLKIAKDRAYIDLLIRRAQIKQSLDIAALQKGKCGYCGREVKGVELVGQRTDLAEGAKARLKNSVAVCSSCGAVGVIDDNGNLRQMSPVQLAELANDPSTMSAVAAASLKAQYEAAERGKRNS